MTTLSTPVRRVTRDTYGYGSHRRKYVVTLQPGTNEALTIKPLGLRSGAFTMPIDSVYQWMVRSEALRLSLERARTIKAKKAQRLAALRVKRAEKRLSATN